MAYFARMKSFVEVVECGGFSAAARNLGRSKALMSKYVRELEDEMGVLLLNRTTRQFSLTEAGQHYYNSAKDILKQVDELQSSLQDADKPLTGRLRVTAPRALVEMNFATPLVEFCEKHPDLTLEVHLEDKLIDIVEKGFDVAIRITRLSDSTMIAKKLTDFKLYLCATPDFVATHGMPKQPADILNMPCVVDTNLRTRNQWHFLDGEGKDMSIQVSGKLEVNSPESIRQAVLSGLGIGIMPAFTAQPELEKGTVVPILEDRLNHSSGVYALYPHRRHVPPKVREFVDFLAIWFKQKSERFDFDKV